MAALTGSIIVTTAGHTKLLASTFAPTKLALGTTSWTPTAASTALTTEVARVDLSGAVETVASDAILHLNAVDDSAAAYTVREIGIFDALNVCLAIYSQATDIAVKASGTSLLVSLDWTIKNQTSAAITLGATTYVLPAATETASGIVERATQFEVLTGTDTTRYVSPATLAGLTATDSRPGLIERATELEVQDGFDNLRAVTALTLRACTATETRKGVIELATVAEVQTGTDTTRAVTPAGLAARAASETAVGLVELATSAEVQAGVDTARAITPAALASRTATTTRTGLIEIATDAEALAGSGASLAVTPPQLQDREDRAKAKWYQRTTTTFTAQGVSLHETNLSGLVASAFYVVIVSMLGRNTTSGGAALTATIAGSTSRANFVDGAAQAHTIQARLQADGSGVISVDLAVTGPVGHQLELTNVAISAHLS